MDNIEKTSEMNLARWVDNTNRAYYFKKLPEFKDFYKRCGSGWYVFKVVVNAKTRRFYQVTGIDQLSKGIKSERKNIKALRDLVSKEYASTMRIGAVYRRNGSAIIKEIVGKGYKEF